MGRLRRCGQASGSLGVAWGRCCGPGPGLTLLQGKRHAQGPRSPVDAPLECHPPRLTHPRPGWVLALRPTPHPPPTMTSQATSPGCPPAQGSLALGHTAWDLPAQLKGSPVGEPSPLLQAPGGPSQQTLLTLCSALDLQTLRVVFAVLGKGCFGLSLTCIMIYKPETSQLHCGRLGCSCGRHTLTRARGGGRGGLGAQGHTVESERTRRRHGTEHTLSPPPKGPSSARASTHSPSPESRLRGCSPTEGP